MMKLNIQLFAADGKIVLETDLDTKDFEKGLDKMQSTSQKAGTSIKNIVAGLGITKLISKAMSTISNSIDDAVARVDTLNNFPKVMSNLGISADEAQESIDKMSEKLAGLPTTLNDGAMAVQRFTSSNGDIKRSTDMFLALNNAILAGGASTEIQASALEQLSQSYAKGRPDMMEWRTAMSAMPAQLKQVATAMGMVNADELGENLRNGTVSMDEFMDAIIKLNKEGTGEFQSFEKQAKNSTNGIKTAITVAKTQVVKGVAGIIDGLNKGLKKANLPSISKIIENLGKVAKKAFDTVANALSKINFKKILEVIKAIAPAIISATTAIIAFKAAMAVKGIIDGVRTAMVALNATMMANPILAVASAMIALVSAVALYASTSEQELTKVEKNIQKLDDKFKEYEETQKGIDERRKEYIKSQSAELENYDDLYRELKLITDENGNVKKGYEERAKYITDTLADALGIEIKLTDGQIENYQELTKQIQNYLEQKEAEILLQAHEEDYKKAMEQRKQYFQDYTQAIDNTKDAQKEYDKALENVKKHTHLTNYEIQGYLELAKKVGSGKASADEKEHFIILSNLIGEYGTELARTKLELEEATEQEEKAGDTYAKNQIKINDYNSALVALKEGNYDAVKKIYDDTVTFNAKTIEDNTKAYETNKKAAEDYLQFLKDNKSQYNEDFIKSEEERIGKQIEKWEQEKEEANKNLESQNQLKLDKTIEGLNAVMAEYDGRKYEFRDAGNGQVQMYIDGMAQGEPMSTAKAQEISNKAAEKLKSGDSYSAGAYVVQGFTNGMNSLVGSLATTARNIGIATLNSLKSSLDIHSPSKETNKIGKYFVKGMIQGLDKTKNELYSDIDAMADEILERMNDSINIETGKLVTDIQTSGTYQMAMAGVPQFNLRDNSVNRTELVVSGKVLADVVNTENRNREVAIG